MEGLALPHPSHPLWLGIAPRTERMNPPTSPSPATPRHTRGSRTGQLAAPDATRSAHASSAAAVVRDGLRSMLSTLQPGEPGCRGTSNCCSRCGNAKHGAQPRTPRLARLARLRAALFKSTFEEVTRGRVTVASALLTVWLVARCAGHLSRQLARSNHSAHEISAMKVAANVPNHTASLP